MTKGEQKAKTTDSEKEADEVEEGVVQRAVQVRLTSKNWALKQL